MPSSNKYTAPEFMIISQFPQHIDPKGQVASCVIFSENGTVLSTNTIGELKTMKKKKKKTMKRKHIQLNKTMRSCNTELTIYFNNISASLSRWELPPSIIVIWNNTNTSYNYLKC